jgi:hypothetical protein
MKLRKISLTRLGFFAALLRNHRKNKIVLVVDTLAVNT